jgi:hypothetical protein
MDWGFLTFTREGKILSRPRMMLPVITYFLVTILNLFLRFSWAFNRIPGNMPFV